MSYIFLGLFGICAGAAGILQTLMLREMRDETGRTFVALFPAFVASERFTAKGLRLRRWWFLAVSLTVGCLLLLATSS